MKNIEIARILHSIASLLEIKEERFKPQAYRKAAQSIESLSEDVADIHARGELQQISGVGEHIAKKVVEIIETGRLKYYNKLKKEVKVDVEGLSRIPSLGPRKILALYKKLKIKNIKDLEKEIKKQKIRKLPGFGEKTELLLQQGIDFVKSSPKRFRYASLIPVVDEIISDFSKEKYVDKIEVAGSFRRRKETIGDLDFVVISKQPEKVMRKFVSMNDVKETIASGKTKSSIRLGNNLQIDLRVVTEKEFGSAMNYFVGNKNHNVALRKIALKKGYTLSEYGLFKYKNNKKGKLVAGKKEEDIYKNLGLQFVPPELRENLGEIEAAQKKSLPKIITQKAVKGFFHTHTKWSDGTNSILEMAHEAENLGFKFISFNDHFGPIPIANPLDLKRLKLYLKAINKAQKKVNLKIFSGVEIEILKDGSLPLSNQWLKKLDVVIASVHLSLKMKEKIMTDRCLKAMSYPINILGHPTDRLLGERPPIELNFAKIFAKAKENDIFLEVNGAPKRMDLSGENVLAGKKIGCKFALSTDAHNSSHLKYRNLSVNLARRGWLERKDILNTWSLPKIERALQR